MSNEEAAMAFAPAVATNLEPNVDNDLLKTADVGSGQEAEPARTQDCVRKPASPQKNPLHSDIGNWIQSSMPPNLPPSNDESDSNGIETELQSGTPDSASLVPHQPPTPGQASDSTANIAADLQGGSSSGVNLTQPQQFADPFPFLSPMAQPVLGPHIEPVPELPPLNNKEEDDILNCSLEKMVAKMRGDTKTPEATLQVKSEVKADEPADVLMPATQIKLSPNGDVIDLTDSPCPSPAPPRPKRKHIPSFTASLSAPIPPPSKRAKTQSQSQSLAQKHADHWLLDGNIVIQVHDTMFRLHRSFLVKHSPWLSELVEGEIDDKPNVCRCVAEDGMPMYTLTLPELTAKDFARLLDGFDNAIKYVHQDPPFSRIAGILRAATALDFADFRHWAIRTLEDHWPASLEEFSSSEPSSAASGNEVKNAAERVVLARTYDVPSILKRAMYELVRAPGYGQPSHGGQSTTTSTVSAQDFHVLIRARDKLTAVWMTTMGASPFSPPFATCASAAGAAAGEEAAPQPQPQPGPRCTTLDPLLSGKAHHKLMRESGIAEEYIYDPICGLQALMDKDWAAEGYCAACVELRREIWGKTRERVWRDLDLWFGLEKGDT